MKLATRWFGLAPFMALTGLALLTVPASAPAQFAAPGARFGPGGIPGLGGVGGGALIANPVGPGAGLNPYGPGTLSASYPNGPLGSFFANPYLNQSDPYGGYLRGSADVINAQSNYLRAYQDAKLKREEVRQAKQDTRRRVFDQWLYERERTPSPEQMRKEFMAEQVKRAANNPPPGEVASGKSLNDLLTALEGMPVKGPVSDLALDDATLRRINVTGGGGGGNVGLLRNEGKLTWPRALANLPDPDGLRATVEENAKTAYDQATHGSAQQLILDRLTTASRKLNDRLTAVVRETDFTEYSDAKRFMRQLDDAIMALKDPNAGKVLEGADGARGKTVSELVRNMLNSGYRFAPAGRGDEPAYQALQSKMASFYNSLQSNNPTP